MHPKVLRYIGKQQIPPLRYGMTNKRRVQKQERLQPQQQKQIPPLRCGMTNKRWLHRCETRGGSSLARNKGDYIGAKQEAATILLRGLPRLNCFDRSGQFSWRGSSLLVLFCVRSRLGR